MHALTLATGDNLDHLAAMYYAPVRERGEPDDDYRRRVLRWGHLRWGSPGRVSEALRLVERVARLNPLAETIGPGMLAQLVADARAIINREE